MSAGPARARATRCRPRLRRVRRSGRSAWSASSPGPRSVRCLRSRLRPDSRLGGAARGASVGSRRHGPAIRGVRMTVTLTVEEVSVEALHPDVSNPRHMDVAELDALTRSMAEFGFVQPVVVRVRRHRHRWPPAALRCPAAGSCRRCRSSGSTSAPSKARLLGLALNSIGGEWDEPLLARAARRPAGSVDITLSGLRRATSSRTCSGRWRRGRSASDPSPSTSTRRSKATKKPRTKPGDLWLLGEHRLLCGDATKPDDVARVLDGTAGRPLLHRPAVQRGAGRPRRPGPRPAEASHRQRRHGPRSRGRRSCGLASRNLLGLGRRCHLPLHVQQGAAPRLPRPRRGRWSLVRHARLAQGPVRARSRRLPARLRAHLVWLARRRQARLERWSRPGRRLAHRPTVASRRSIRR